MLKKALYSSKTAFWIPFWGTWSQSPTIRWTVWNGVVLATASIEDPPIHWRLQSYFTSRKAFNRTYPRERVQSLYRHLREMYGTTYSLRWCQRIRHL